MFEVYVTFLDEVLHNGGRSHEKVATFEKQVFVQITLRVLSFVYAAHGDFLQGVGFGTGQMNVGTLASEPIRCKNQDFRVHDVRVR